MTPSASAAAGVRTRRAYLDWLRGIAVLLMILAHLLDGWTRMSDRQSSWFIWGLTVGGIGSTLFLLLAGVAVALSAGSKWRRSRDRAAASGAVVRRGLQIFALAFLFRAQAWILGWSDNPQDLLKVDMLNIMGPSIACAALLWRSAEATGTRAALYAAAALAAAFLTPPIRLALLAGIPDPLEAYVVPVAGLSNFVFFPWVGFVFAGGCVGVLIDAAAPGRDERSLVSRVGAAGAAIVLAAYGASFLPSPYARSEFWTSSPSFFFIRLGIGLIGIAVAYAWYSAAAQRGWSPVHQLGKTSLFVYWIHVEMIYGLISRPLHKALGSPHIWIAYVLLSGFLLACSVLKDRLVGVARRSSWISVAPT